MNGEPSQAEVNKALRVLKGIRGKMTCTVHLPDGRSFEFQANSDPQVVFNVEDRSLWLVSTGVESYSKVPVMRWPDGAVLLCERNIE